MNKLEFKFNFTLLNIFENKITEELSKHIQFNFRQNLSSVMIILRNELHIKISENEKNN